MKRRPPAASGLSLRLGLDPANSKNARLSADELGGARRRSTTWRRRGGHDIVRNLQPRSSAVQWRDPPKIITAITGAVQIELQTRWPRGRRRRRALYNGIWNCRR